MDEPARDDRGAARAAAKHRERRLAVHLTRARGVFGAPAVWLRPKTHCARGRARGRGRGSGPGAGRQTLTPSTPDCARKECIPSNSSPARATSGSITPLSVMGCHAIPGSISRTPGDGTGCRTPAPSTPHPTRRHHPPPPPPPSPPSASASALGSAPSAPTARPASSSTPDQYPAIACQQYTNLTPQVLAQAGDKRR